MRLMTARSWSPLLGALKSMAESPFVNEVLH